MRARGIVVRAVDGDTVWVRFRVRLLQSAPDTGRDAEIATEKLKRRWPMGTRVQLIPGAVDAYGRFVGQLIEDDSRL